MKAIRMYQVGGPEVLQFEDCPSPTPGRGEALIDIQAVGVNFADIYFRSGVFPPSSLPMIPGFEAAGVVSAVGEGVTQVKAGDVVAYTMVPNSYAQQVVAPEDMLVKMPEGLDARTGAAVILQGLTAHYLAHNIYPLKAGVSILVHAGAGGVGLLLIQMAKRNGATILTTVSTEEKAAMAKEAGADEAIIYTRDDFEEEVMMATGGKGVNVVFDSVGKTTFDKSLNCLMPRGYLALFGEASGLVPSVAMSRLNAGSLVVTRPSLNHFLADREELLWRTGDVLGWVASGELNVHIGGTFPLADAAEAQRQLEGRGTMGKLLLIP